MAKPPCDFKIKRTVQPNGNIQFATDPDFAECSVHIAINGLAVGPQMGHDVGDYHIVQAAHSSVMVTPLKPDPQGEVVFEVECAHCGPTLMLYGKRPPDAFKLSTLLTILLFPLLLAAWALWMIWDQIVEWWRALRALF